MAKLRSGNRWELEGCAVSCGGHTCTLFLAQARYSQEGIVDLRAGNQDQEG